LESIVMKRQVNVLLALAGAAMLLGCQIDPVGKAPGGLEPSASSQQSDERSGTARDSSSQSGDSGEDDSGDGGSDSGGSGGMN
jgi:hypothetical protein